MAKNGLWIWYENRLPTNYLERISASGCRKVYLKVLDDASRPIFWDFNCTESIINGFEASGIEVWAWGYVFDRRNSTDIPAILNAIRNALDRGCKGFIFDIEREVENPATHLELEQLLTAAKEIVPTDGLGYTSFGHPGFHPNIPWQMLNSYCDLQFPQMYFEHWTFGGSNVEEVNRAIAAHQRLNLTKPILPIWSSEPMAPQPATIEELNQFLERYEGSSIWRAPNVNEAGHGYHLSYNDTDN